MELSAEVTLVYEKYRPDSTHTPYRACKQVLLAAEKNAKEMVEKLVVDLKEVVDATQEGVKQWNSYCHAAKICLGRLDEPILQSVLLRAVPKPSNESCKLARSLSVISVI
jgi:hypothetical protein